MTKVAVPELPWLLPAGLTTPGRHPRRSARDWLVDTLFFLVALSFALFAILDRPYPDSVLGVGNNGPAWLLPLDALLGLAACAALWVRRRWPVTLAVVSLLLGCFSVVGAIALLFMLFTVVVHRPLVVSATVSAASVAAGMVFELVRPDPAVGPWGTLFWNLAIVGSVLAWGMFVRARRQLVLSLRERADRAEAEQQLRVAQARHLERSRIAREMHDVLAHRISLLSLHAGALEFRPDARPGEVARAAGVIRSSAHLALQDLREVIGVLRTDDPDGAPDRPQPTVADLPALVAESRAAGMRVDLTDRVADPASVPLGVGRNAYRIVQEALTNARKHAPGARVAVELTGAVGAGLTVQVRNPRPVGEPSAPAIPGTGTGLIGLAERATLAGGRLSHGCVGSGEFRLTAWLPWPT